MSETGRIKVWQDMINMVSRAGGMAEIMSVIRILTVAISAAMA
jgi:hypothetical protein